MKIINQFRRLNQWTFKGSNSLKILNSTLITSIILWNQTKIWKLNKIVE